ncbi:hypothetical protein [Salipaludibacillus daqingensis]|uniref:hypothetical protein n=1 Tax=Salipaludibacillus daqingensis TaxID=3041001 RepID=UPI0024746F53|nr:hypothetical protein [Salipaludibacillus daqingensis]
MNLKKNKSKYPYILLGIIHLIMLIYTFYKSKQRKKHVVLLFSFIGWAYILDYIVIVLFQGYVYTPKFLKQKDLDNIFGSIMSQFFYVPVSALFITVFGLGWKVKLVFSICYSLIEIVFIYLGIFKHNWWKTKYTFVLIFSSFFFNDRWNKMITKEYPRMLFFSLFSFVQVTWMNIIFILAVLRMIKYGKKHNHSWKTHIKVAPLFGLLFGYVTTSLVKTGGLLSEVKSFLFMFTIDLILLQKRMLKTKSFIILPFIYITTITSAKYFKKLVYQR